MVSLTAPSSPYCRLLRHARSPLHRAALLSLGLPLGLLRLLVAAVVQQADEPRDASSGRTSQRADTASARRTITGLAGLRSSTVQAHPHSPVRPVAISPAADPRVQLTSLARPLRPVAFVPGACSGLASQSYRSIQPSCCPPCCAPTGRREGSQVYLSDINSTAGISARHNRR
jgi:hypothetical protein